MVAKPRSITQQSFCRRVLIPANLEGRYLMQAETIDISFRLGFHYALALKISPCLNKGLILKNSYDSSLPFWKESER